MAEYSDPWPMFQKKKDEFDAEEARKVQAEAVGLHAQDASTDALAIYHAEKRADIAEAMLAEVEKSRDVDHLRLSHLQSSLVRYREALEDIASGGVVFLPEWYIDTARAALASDKEGE